jgi:hypothetical protein
MPNLASYLNALILQRIMTWTVSSYKAFSSALVSMYQRSKAWVMGQVKRQQRVIEQQQNEELINQVKGILAGHILGQPDTLAKLIITMKQRDLIESLSEDEVNEAYNRFSSCVTRYAYEGTNFSESEKPLLMNFLNAIKALNKICLLNSYIVNMLSRYCRINICVIDKSE